MATSMRASRALQIEIIPSEKYRPLLVTGDVLERCASYLQLLFRDLELPIDPTLKVGVARKLPKKAVLRLLINDEQVTIWWLPKLDADELTYALSQRLLICRALMIDVPLVRQVWGDWFPAHAALVDDAAFATKLRDLFRELVSRGLRLGRVRRHLREGARDVVMSESIPGIVARVMSETKEIAVSLLLSRPHYARCFDGDAVPSPSPGETSSLSDMLDTMSDGLFYELGIVHRMNEVRVDPALRSPWFQIRWNDLAAPPIKGLEAHEFLVNRDPRGLRLLGFESQEAINPASGGFSAIMSGDADQRERCTDAGLVTWGPEGYVVLHMGAEIRRNAGAFVTRNLVTLYQVRLDDTSPRLIQELARRFDIDNLAEILRLLVDEGISIRDLSAVFNALLMTNAVTTADVSGSIVFAQPTGIQWPVSFGRTVADLDSRNYADCVRSGFKRYISHKFAISGLLRVFLLTPAIEQRLREETPLSAREHAKLLDAVGRKSGGYASSAVNAPIILTVDDVRRKVRDATAFDFPDGVVLSYGELAPVANILPIARIESPF